MATHCEHMQIKAAIKGVYVLNVYDKAYELKRALTECQEVKDYKSALEKVKANPTNKSMLDDFRKKQIEIQAKQYSGKQPGKEEMDELERLYNVVSLNPDIKNFLQCEYRFSLLMNDISKTISEAVDIGIEFEDEKY